MPKLLGLGSDTTTQSHHPSKGPELTFENRKPILLLVDHLATHNSKSKKQKALGRYQVSSSELGHHLNLSFAQRDFVKATTN